MTLAPATLDRLKGRAEPLVDAVDSVVNRAIDALEALNGGKSVSPDHGLRSVNPAAPPNLAYTTVHSVVLDGKAFAPAGGATRFVERVPPWRQCPPIIL